MEEVTNLIWVLIGIIILLFAMTIIFIDHQFKKMQKGFWDNRHVDIIEPAKMFDLAPRKINRGPRTKPKFSSDEKLFENERNPAK